ncbi:MAG: hypothetical protein AB1700_13070 [Bacillota bacterium]
MFSIHQATRGLEVLRPGVASPLPPAVALISLPISALILTPLYLGEESGWRSYLKALREQELAIKTELDLEEGYTE